MADKRFLDTQQVAGYLDINEKQVYTLIHERGLPATKITGKWLFPRHLVDRWVESSVVNTPDPFPFLQTAADLLLIAGSDDPLLVKFISLFRNRFPDTLVLQSRAGSSDGLLALKRGLVHIACVHLMDQAGSYSADHLRNTANADIAVVTFAARRQGLLLPPGNPLGIRDLPDAFGREIRWAVRDTGTGTRALMDREMDRLGTDPDSVRERSVPVQSHIEAALAVREGKADTGLGVEAAAGMTGLSFIPVRKERFDMVIRKENFFLPQVEAFIGLLRDPGFTGMSESLAGYDLQECGRIVME